MGGLNPDRKGHTDKATTEAASQEPEYQGPPATTRRQESGLERMLLQSLQKEPRRLTPWGLWPLGL